MKIAFKYLISDIKHGENVDIYITLFLSLILAVLGVIGAIQVAILSAGILATLSVLAYSMLATRRTLSEFSQAIISLHPTADVLLRDRSTFGSFRDRLNGVNTIWLSGASLIALWSMNRDLLFEKVGKGGKIRVLLFDPASSHLPILAEQLSVRPAKLEADITTTIEDCKELVKISLVADKLEVRQTQMIPGYSMVIFNPLEQNGQMIVEYLGHHSNINERPHVEFEATRDRRWFAYYLKQYDELWKSATPCKLDDAK